MPPRVPRARYDIMEPRSLTVYLDWKSKSSKQRVHVSARCNAPMLGFVDMFRGTSEDCQLRRCLRVESKNVSPRGPLQRLSVLEAVAVKTVFEGEMAINHAEPAVHAPLRCLCDQHCLWLHGGAVSFCMRTVSIHRVRGDRSSCLSCGMIASESAYIRTCSLECCCWSWSRSIWSGDPWTRC